MRSIGDDFEVAIVAPGHLTPRLVAPAHREPHEATEWCRVLGPRARRGELVGALPGPSRLRSLTPVLDEEGLTVDHETMMRSAYERVSGGDLAGFGELVADDFVEHEEVPGVPPTKEGTLEYFRMLFAAFPDMRMDVEDLIASGDKAVARVNVTATHRGEFMGVPATGNRVAMQIIDIMRFDDAGLVAEHWGVADMLSLMQQLGVVPAGPPA
jgi:steroid delta-isomerase-like uncharacterized protein